MTSQPVLFFFVYCIKSDKIKASYDYRFVTVPGTALSVRRNLSVSFAGTICQRLYFLSDESEGFAAFSCIRCMERP